MEKKSGMKFVFIGAGSSVFTLRLVGDILGEKSIVSGELVLVDIDETVLKVTDEAVRAMLRYANRDFSVESYTDYKKALPGADFVFMTIATGGYERWKQDIAVSTRHGVNQAVGDTIGPGGIIRALRTIPVVVDIAREMERVCPDAWMINYANPEGALVLALQTYTKIRSFGLCHGTPNTADWLASKVFQVERERFTYRAAGINHFTWFLEMRIDGEDVYPLLRQKLVESGMDREEPISLELFDIYGCYPAPHDRHVGEFVPYYMKDRVIRDTDPKWKNNDFVVVQRWRDEAQALLDDVRLNGKGYDHFLQGSGETATHFIRALTTGEPAKEMVNVINKGYIDNVSDVIVELPTYIDEFGLHPQKIGDLPDGIAAQCDRLGREYRLIVDAAVQCDYKKALQAICMDPLCANCDYPEKLLKDLIRENLDLLPEQWKETV